MTKANLNTMDTPWVWNIGRAVHHICTLVIMIDAADDFDEARREGDVRRQSRSQAGG